MIATQEHLRRTQPNRRKQSAPRKASAKQSFDASLLVDLVVSLERARVIADQLELLPAAALLRTVEAQVAGAVAGRPVPSAPTSGAPALSEAVSHPRDLSKREIQCLQHLVDGVPPKRIAVKLDLSEAAIRLYLRRAKKRLGCATTMQAAVKAFSLGLVMIDPSAQPGQRKNEGGGP